MASDLISKDKKVRLATFLNVIGDEGLEKYDGFLFDSDEDKEDIEKVIELFDKHCAEVTNILNERYLFL